MPGRSGSTGRAVLPTEDEQYENYRQIAKDAPKYAAVMLTKKDKMDQLQKVLDIVKSSETAFTDSTEPKASFAVNSSPAFDNST